MKEVGKSNKVEEVTRLIALVSLIVIAFGYASLSLYYYKWGITISSYIDASEILLAFTSYFYGILLSLVVVALYFVLLVITSFANLQKSENDNDLLQEESSDLGFRKWFGFPKMKKVLKLFLKAMAFVIAGLYVILLVRYKFQSIESLKELYSNLTYNNIAFEFALVFFVTPMFSVYLFLRMFFSKQNLRRFLRFGFLVFGSIYFYQMIDLQYMLRKNEIISQKVELVLEDDEIINTKKDSLIFIGSTRSYLFFSEKKKKDSGIRIIPFDRVREHTISQ